MINLTMIKFYQILNHLVLALDPSTFYIILFWYHITQSIKIGSEIELYMTHIIYDSKTLAREALRNPSSFRAKSLFL